MSKAVFLKPRMSEKAYESSKSLNVFVFVVDKFVNKLTIKENVEKQFKVSVENVRVAHLPAKNRRSPYLGNRKFNRGVQPGVKKAFVTLKKGDSIPIFAEEEAEAEKQEKLAKKLAKENK